MIFLIGMPKCRTTSLTSYLIKKYEYYLPEDKFEPHIFGDEKKITKFTNSLKREGAYIDGSQSYILNPSAYYNILKTVENPIFIFSFRDYSERFFSHWEYFFKFANLYYAEINKIPSAFQPQNRNYVSKAEKIQIENYLKNEDLNLSKISYLFFQHIIIQNSNIDKNIFFEIEKELKKGPLNFFNYEMKYYIKNKKFIPYCSILAFNYYGHNIEYFIKILKKLRFKLPKIYYADFDDNKIDIPNETKTIEPDMEKLNVNKNDLNKDIPKINQFFKDDQNIINKLIEEKLIKKISS